MNKLAHALLVFALLICPASLFAQDKKEADAAVFTVIALNRSNATEFKTSMIIKKYLDGFSINDDFRINERINFSSCVNNECFDELLEVAGGGIVVIISITSEDVKINEKQISRYVTEDIVETRYTIHVRTIDLDRHVYELKFTETFNDRSKLMAGADGIGRKIRDYYLLRKTDNIAHADDNVNADDDEEDNPAHCYDITGLTVSLSALLPFGKFGDIASSGYGANAALNGIVPAFPRISISPEIGIYWMSPAGSNVDSAWILMPGITLGYGFCLSETIVVTPLAGLCYSFMLVDGATGDSPGDPSIAFYYNPAFSLGVEGAYRIGGGYSLVSEIDFCSITERSSVLLFGGFNLGMRINL